MVEVRSRFHVHRQRDQSGHTSAVSHHRVERDKGPPYSDGTTWCPVLDPHVVFGLMLSLSYIVRLDGTKALFEPSVQGFSIHPVVDFPMTVWTDRTNPAGMIGRAI